MNNANKTILAVVVTATIVGGGVYFWQKKDQTTAPASAPEKATQNQVSQWNKYSNNQYKYEISYPTTGAVRAIKATPEAGIVHQMEINEFADNLNRDASIVHVTVYSGDKGKKFANAKMDSFQANKLQMIAKAVNGNSLTIYSGEIPSDVGGGFFSTINAFLASGSFVYELEILGAGLNIDKAPASTYLNSFKINLGV